MDLKDLKSDYGKLAKKYKLPGFQELNECFEIDRIDKDSDCLLREIRKTMMDRIVRYIHFIEMMINPAQAPPMFMIFVKNISDEERKVLEKVYQNFIELELRSLKLEIDYSEKDEFKAIVNIFSVWNKTKSDLRSVIGIMEKNWKGTSEKKEKTYFG